MNRVPEIFGLVLAGGRSTRMGTDKGLLNLNGISQRAFLFQELRTVCAQVFTSCRQEQSIEKELNPLTDAVSDSGPLGGLYTAFHHRSNCAWLSVAVDMPNVDAEVLKELIAHRDPRKLATCYVNTETQLPEPLLTIWEPEFFPVLVECIARGSTSLRRILSENHVKVMWPKEESVLCNVNFPGEVDEWERVRGQHMKALARVWRSVTPA